MKKNSQKHVETMIGEDAVINGEISLKGGAIISGKVVGNVQTTGTVRVTRTGTVEGDMKASEATIGGTVHGNVQADKVVLRSDSKVHGDIIYKQLMIEEGASFEGRCDLASNKSSEETTLPEASQPAVPEDSGGESSLPLRYSN
ncbi:MAG: polymer-forming cytoskeletal protein [Candidatus Neomarinimicrobiota bacterium]|nr:polymer-forming cytoskeletal protein [Candidatus Neomarinimicrobiota bacterium]